MGNLLWDDFTSSEPHSLTAQTPNHHFPATHIWDKGYAEPLGTNTTGLSSCPCLCVSQGVEA